MRTTATIQKTPKKSLFNKKAGKTKKAKVQRFVKEFYGQYGKMMSRLADE